MVKEHYIIKMDKLFLMDNLDMAENRGMEF